MGAADWTRVTGSLLDTDPGRQALVAATRGLTPDVTRGVLGMRGLTPGAYALRATPTLAVGFDPIAPGLGGEITVALTQGNEGAEPFAFACLQTDDVTANSYKLGLTRSGRIALCKGTLAAGLPDSAPGALGVLRRSTEAAIPRGEWVHLRMEVVCSAITGDSVINVYRSTTDNLALPIWEPIPGLDRFIDDGLGVNSGSRGISGGHLGMATMFDRAGAWAAFDQVKASRQT